MREGPLPKGFAFSACLCGPAPVCVAKATGRRRQAISAVKNLGQQYLAKNPWGYCGHGGTGVSYPASFMQGM